MINLANSTSTMYIQNTIFRPCVKSISQVVAEKLYTQMVKDKAFDLIRNSELFFFSEEKYIEEKPNEFDQDRIELLRSFPSENEIQEFLIALYDCARFSPECCIICLVYINRLQGFCNLRLHPTNWRPILLSSLLIAQKVWDDKCLDNVQFVEIYPFFTTQEINKLEQKFLQLLDYNVVVNGKLYHSLYYEIQSQLKLKGKDIIIQALNVDQSAALEIRSNDLKLKAQQNPLRLCNSLGEKEPSRPKASID
ncbi:hypothetical protein pb186bvf_019912 [Paramecium bursaria]